MGMTERDRKVLIIVVAAVILGGFWMLILGPKRTAVSEAETAKQQAQAALDTATAAESAAKNVKAEKPVAYSKLLRLGKAIPVDDDFASLLVQISDLSDDAKVSFIDLQASQGAAANGPTGSVGGSTCEQPGGSGASGATASATAGATTATGATGASGSTAESSLGQDRDSAQGAASTSNATNAVREAASADAAACNAAPTLADLSAQAAGLTGYQYTFSFEGSFFNLDTILAEVLDMVEVHNARVKVVGRLLDIKSLSISVEDFPLLRASVQMTGYSLPTGGSAAAGQPSGGGAPAATGTPAAAAAPAAQ